MATLKQLIECEISDFFAGFGHPGEPETPEEMQSQLLARVMPLLAGLEREPVGITDRSEIEGLKRGEMANVMPPDFKGVDAGDEVLLYETPHLPQPAAVSEKMIDTFEVEFRRAFEVSNGVEQLIEIGYQGEKFSLSIRDAATWWKLGRAAMLQGADPAADNTNQQFESLSRGDK